jgi:hypothetical protein
MKVVVWRLGECVVRVEHCHIFGEATISIDGSVVFHRERKLYDDGFRYLFFRKGEKVEVLSEPHLFSFKYQMLVGGRLVLSDEEKEKLEEKGLFDGVMRGGYTVLSGV